MKLIEVSRPTPAAGKLLVHNYAIGVNFVDTMWARNMMLNYYGRVEPGDWALVRAAAGAMGTALVDTATAAGMKVIAVTTGEKLAFSRSRGAVETIDYKRENVTDRVGAITDGAGVALALNPVSGGSATVLPSRFPPSTRTCVIDLPDFTEFSNRSRKTWRRSASDLRYSKPFLSKKGRAPIP